MSAEPTYSQSAMDDADQEVAKALIVLFKLPDEAVASIKQSMQALHLSFTEAALHTGLVTQTELKEAREWVRRQDRGQGRSIVEEALRRHSARREMVVWDGERLVPGRDLIMAHDPDNPRSEAIRTLRHELLMRTSGRRGAGIFALLSPGANEGRSQLSAELAIAFAQLGSRTLLVDADMRRPRQHVLFGAETGIGLAQALADNTQRIHGIEGLPQLALLTSGGIPPNPLELLSANRLERLVSDWRRSYEFVVIDTPPTSEFADGLAAATAAGNVVVVGRTKATTFNALTEMRRKLETTHSRVLGAVINDF